MQFCVKLALTMNLDTSEAERDSSVKVFQRHTTIAKFSTRIVESLPNFWLSFDLKHKYFYESIESRNGGS